MAPPDSSYLNHASGTNWTFDNATLRLLSELIERNVSNNISLEDLVTPTIEQQAFDNLYPLSLVVPLSIVYAFIFIVGVLGNVSTCIVISKNRSMATATNYYLFSLAISDMLLLVTGLPPEMYHIWSPEKYVFGQAFCIIQSLAAEMSANASILTITAFTVERYLAICHPFLSHTMSKLSRVVWLIVAIWLIALCLAIPQGIQFGIEYEVKDGKENSLCTVVKTYFPHAFEISTFVFFVGPMTLISVLYVLIGIQLRRRKNVGAQRPSVANAGSNESRRRFLRHTAAQNRVVKMLVAVVGAFFICWAPFHAQRLLAVYLTSASPEAQQKFIGFYTALNYTSGVLYYLSTCVNPIVYHIMSNKFRKEFTNTFINSCRRRKASQDDFRRQYSITTKGLRNSSRRMTQRSFSDDEDNIPAQTTITTMATRMSRKSDGFLGDPKQSNNNHHLQDNGEDTNPEMVALQELNNRRLLYRKFPRKSSISLRRKSSGNAAKSSKKRFNFFPFNWIKALTHYRPAVIVVVARSNDESDSDSGTGKAPSRGGGGGTQKIAKSNEGRRKRPTGDSEDDSEISNSSLQDIIDDTEYNSNDLAKYMREVNDNL